jgi:hypothetical protein
VCEFGFHGVLIPFRPWLHDFLVVGASVHRDLGVYFCALVPNWEVGLTSEHGRVSNAKVWGVAMGELKTSGVKSLVSLLIRH